VPVFFLYNFKFQFINLTIVRPFLVSARKGPKEADLRGATHKCAPLGIPSRIAVQHSKMFRFLNAFILQTYRFTPQSPLKIGTFSAGGGQSGGSGVRGEWCSAQRIQIGRLPVAIAPKFLHLPVTPRPRTISLVTFLFGSQESNIVHWIDKLQFITSKICQTSCALLQHDV